MNHSRHIWKTRSFTSMESIHRLQSAWHSSSAAFGKGRVFSIEDNQVETNLPWSMLTTFFQIAYVPLERSKWVTDVMSSEERYKDA